MKYGSHHRGFVLSSLTKIALQKCLRVKLTLSNVDGDEETFGLPFTLNDAFSDEFKPSSVVGSWLFGRTVCCVCELFHYLLATLLEVLMQQISIVS